MSEATNNDTKNTGNLNFELNHQSGLDSTLSLYENAGVVFPKATLGVEAAASFTHSTGYDYDYFMLLPACVYADIPFSKEETPSDPGENGLKLSGGALDTVSEYGEVFPIHGAGVDLRLRAARSSDNPSVFGQFKGRYGRLGGFDIGSEGADMFKTQYGGVNLLLGSVRLGLDFNGSSQLAAEGVLGRLGRDEGYAPDEEDDPQSPDAYDKIYGAALLYRLNSKPARLTLAYHYLNSSGGNNYPELNEYFGTNDSLERITSSFSGDLALNVSRKKNSVWEIGARGNIQKGGKETKFFDTSAQPFFERSYLNQWHANRTYLNGYVRYGNNPFSIEAGGGYMEDNRNYSLDCEPFCSVPPQGSSDESNFNLFVSSTVSWGESE